MDKKGKQKELEALAAEFKRATNAFLVTFQGLAVENDTILRREMRKNNVKYKVIKNTLAQKAVAGTPLEVLNTKFVGMTAIAILEDPVALAQLITKFSKDYAQFKFKAGVVDGRVIDVKDLEVLVNIPSREQLISQMMFLINSGAQRIATATAGVARNLAIVIDQVREQKEQQSA